MTMATSYGLYAYGLVGKRLEDLAIQGVDRLHEVFPVEEHGVCVMVSVIDIDHFQRQVQQMFVELTDTPDAARGAEAILQAHEDVVDTLMQHTPVVPLKFGTILRDEAAARRLLLDEEERWRQLLAAFTGKAEWGLKIYIDTRVFQQHTTRAHAPSPEPEKLSKGSAYLFKRKMEAEAKNDTAARLTELTTAIFQEMGKGACEAKLNKTLPQKLTGKKQEMLLNGVFLLEKEQAARFCELGKRLREQYEAQGLTLEVSGPWPPYSFV